MKEISKNPVIIGMLCFFAASSFFAYCNLLAKIIVSSLGIILCITLSIIYLKKYNNNFLITVISIMLGTAIAGIISYFAFNHRAESIDCCSNHHDTIKIRISDCDYSLPYTARYIAVVEKSELIPTGTCILFTSEKTGLSDGTILWGEVVYSSLSDLNSGSFNAKRYYLPKQIMICADDLSTEIVGASNTFSLKKIFSELNEKLCAKIIAHSSYSSAGLQSAVLLGNKDLLTDEVARDFRRLGISHLLVVSGTHFAILISLFEQSMRKLMINRRYRSLLNIAFIIFFMFLMGFSPSVTRAGIMCLIAQFAQIISRKANQLNSLALAGTVIVLLNPYLAIDCGMQLSFAAAYSCIVFSKFRSYIILKIRATGGIRNKSKRITRKLISIISIILLTTFINISMLPLTWLYFGEISLLAIPANIIFIPAITVLMYLSGLYLILYPLKVFIIPLSSLTDWYCSGVEWLANSMSKPSFSLISINYEWSIFLLIPLCILILVLPYLRRDQIKRLGIVTLSLVGIFTFCICFANSIDYNNVRISYVSEKKNDGLVIKSNGKVMLCDFSDASNGFSYEMLNEMSALHECEIDTLMLTHYHSKHVQLFNRLSKREIVRNIILPTPINDEEYIIYDMIYKDALAHGTRVFTLDSNEVYVFGDTEIVMFERKYISRSTHPITAIQVSAHGETATYASCSFNQSNESIRHSLEASEHIILGKHSPVYKKEYKLKFSDKLKNLVISNDALEHMDLQTKELAESHGYILDTKLHRIIIKKTR